MKKNDRLGILLLKNPFPIFLGLFLVSFFLVSSFFSGPIYKINLLLLVLSILITELILRLILYFIYGKKYIYRFKPFKFVNNKKMWL